MRKRESNELKNTDVEWLGSIPKTWNVERLKSTVKYIQNGDWGDTPNGDKSDIICIRVADFDRNNLRIPDADFTIRSIAKEKKAGKLLKKGDLIIEKSGGGDNQPVGAVMMYDLDHKAVCSNFAAKMSIKEAYSSSFLRYYHFHLYHARVNTRSIKQTTGIQNLDSDLYLNESVSLPPKPEQKAIATFLDRKTQAIDQLIEKKQKLIEKLKEKRQALITQAVTKGLNPDAPMKDSGIEWLGDTPEKWQVLKLKYFFELQRGHDLSKDEFIKGEYPVCGSNGPIGHHNKYTTNGPGITVGRSGSVGEVNFVDSNFWAHNTCLYVYKTYNNNIRYIYYLLLALDLKSYSEGSAVGTLNRNNLHPMYISVPVTFQEQSAIASYLDGQMDKFRSSFNLINSQIDKLKEYRQSLISAAVTGKIDVRDEIEEIQA